VPRYGAAAVYAAPVPDIALNAMNAKTPHANSKAGSSQRQRADEASAGAVEFRDLAHHHVETKSPGANTSPSGMAQTKRPNSVPMGGTVAATDAPR
jgi:hypothetical protein